jgi:hypothetical protein
MHWLLQSNLSTEEGQRPFVDALNNLVAQEPTASWSFVKLVPFAGTVEPERDYGPKVFPLGSTSMTTASRIYGWSPGVIFDPDTFRFEAWRDHWGRANLINGDGVVTWFGNAVAIDKVFMRPCMDLKAFTGLTLNPDQLVDWQRRVADGEQSTRTEMLSLTTPVLVAPVKVILREWRFFVVNGVVVSGSQYAHLGRRDRSAQIDSDVWEFARDMVAIWQPAACFVLDIGETAGGRLGIVEVNTLNSSGVYLSDFNAVVLAIERFYESI